MKILITILLLLSFTAYGQRKFVVSEIWTKPSGDSTITKNLVTKVIVPREGLKVKFTTPVDTARLFMPDDGTQYVFEGTFKKVGFQTQFDTVYTILETVESEDSRVIHVNMSSVVNSLKPGIRSKSFSYVTDASKSASSTFSFIGSMIELYSERFAGHGIIDVFIDGVKAGTFNQGIAPLVTDFSRMAPTIRKKLVTGQHTVSVRSSTGQHMIDFFSVYEYKLVPKP